MHRNVGCEERTELYVRGQVFPFVQTINGVRQGLCTEVQLAPDSCPPDPFFEFKANLFHILRTGSISVS